MNISKCIRHKILLMLTAVMFVSLCIAVLPKQRTAAAGLDSIYVKLIIEGKEYVYRSPDIKYLSGFDRAIEESFEKDSRGRLGRQKSPLRCSYYLSGMREKLEELASLYYIEPEDGKISFSPDSREMFDIIPDKKGRMLDTEKLAEDISDALSAGNSFDSHVPLLQTHATHTQQTLQNSTALRKEFITSFPASSPQRRHNIALSLSFINGTVLAPGEVFSFNQTVGERTEERGFKTAKVILNGEFVDGTGGGVCQSSTTLYNAALFAGLKIAQQHRHSLAVSYVKPSFDAMVNSVSADLKVENDSGNYIFIKAFTKGDNAHIRIYGQKNPYTIVGKSIITKVYAPPKEKLVVDTQREYPDIHAGTRRVIIPSKPKMESIAILEYYSGGKLVKTTQIRKDVYGQLAGLEIIGTAPAPKLPAGGGSLLRSNQNKTTAKVLRHNER